MFEGKKSFVVWDHSIQTLDIKYEETFKGARGGGGERTEMKENMNSVVDAVGREVARGQGHG